MPRTAILTDSQRRRAQTAALLSQLFATVVTMVVAGQYMMLYAADVLDLSPQKIAVIFSLAPFASAFRLPSLPYIQRFGLVRTLQAARIAQALVLIALIAIPASYLHWPLLATLIVLFVTFRELGLGTVWQPLMRHITTAEDRGRFFGRMRTCFTLANLSLSAAIAAFVGQEMQEGAYKIILAVALLGTVNSHFWARRIPEPSAGQQTPIPPFWRSIEHVFFLLKRSRLFRLPLIITLAITAGQVPIGIVYFREALHVPASLLGAQIFCATLGQVLSLMLWGRIADTLGFRPMLAGLLWLTSALTLILWFVKPFEGGPQNVLEIARQFPLNVTALLVFGFVGGILNAGVGIAVTSVTHYHVSNRDSLATLNLFALFQLLFQSLLILGLGIYLEQLVLPRMAPPNPESLFYFDWYKAYSAGVVPALMLFAIPFVLRLPNLKPWFGINDFFSTLRYTPWRALLGSRHVHDEDERSRIALARSLGESPNPLNIEPLAELLQDPSYEVKVEAIRSLARSQSNLAGQTLCAVLADEERRSLWDHAAWALGELKHEPAVDLLIQRLDTSAPVRARAMAARALGKIRNPQALQPLLQAMREEQTYLHVVSGCCWALLQMASAQEAEHAFRGLARLKEREERYEMLSILSRWLGVTDRWVLLSNSRASAWQSLNEFIDDFPSAWQEQRRDIIDAFKARDHVRMQQLLAQQLEKGTAEEQKIQAALLATMGEQEQWSPLDVLASAYLLLHYEETDDR